MRLVKKISIIILSICLLVPLFGVVSCAASGKSSISSTSGKVGSTVSVTCKVTSQSGAIGSVDVVLKYDQSALQYVSGSDGTNGGAGRVQYVAATTSTSATSMSFTMKFKILKEGASTISSQAIEAYTLDEQLMSVSGSSGKVTGKTATVQTDTRDTNNNLGSLQVSVGTLDPAFNASTKAYKVVVPDTTTEVSISATAQSSKASVIVTGGKNLRLGTNTATVTVKAENGSVSTYVITILCGEAEKIALDDGEYTINQDFTDAQIPAGFTRTKLTYKGRQYEGLGSTAGSLQLLHLQNESGAAFYIYDEAKQEFYNFVQISIAEGKYIVPLPLEEVEAFADAETIELDVQQKKVVAWKLNDEFSIVNALNQNGEKVLYQYDSIDGTFQRYADIQVEGTEQTAKEQNGIPNKYYLYAIVGLGSLVLILSTALIYFVASRKKRHEGRKKKALKRLEKQREIEEEPKKRSKAWLWILISLLILGILGAAAYGVNWYLEAQKASEEKQVNKEDIEEYVGKPVTELMEKIEEIDYTAVYFQGEENFTERIDMIKEDYLVSEVRVSDVEKKVKISIEKGNPAVTEAE